MLLSEDRKMSVALKKRGIIAETVYRAEQDPTFPIKILPARYLSKLYQELGEPTTEWCQYSHVEYSSLKLM